MGWLSGWKSKEALIDHIKRDITTIQNYEPSMPSALRGNNLWTLLQKKDDPAQKVILLHLLSGSDGEWGYKSLSEGDFPSASNCPVGMLKASTYKESAWRDHLLLCRENEKLIAKQIRAGLQVDYGGKTYTLEQDLGAKGWLVALDETGENFRMPLNQVKQALEQKSRSEAKWYFENMVKTQTLSWDRFPETAVARWVNRSLGGNVVGICPTDPVFQKDVYGISEDGIRIVLRDAIDVKDGHLMFEEGKSNSMYLESDDFVIPTGGLSTIRLSDSSVASEKIAIHKTLQDMGAGKVEITDCPKEIDLGNIRANAIDAGILIETDDFLVYPQSQSNECKRVYFKREQNLSLQDLNSFLEKHVKDNSLDSTKQVMQWCQLLTQEAEQRNLEEKAARQR